MKFLVVILSYCFLLMETTATEKGLAQLSGDGILNNIVKLTQSVTEMKSDMDELKKTQQTSANVSGGQQQVAYEVVLDSHSTVGANEPLKFDHVTLNKGNAYNPQSGIFIVPVNGTYQLWANVMCNGKDNGFHLTLRKEGREIVGGHSGHELTYATTSINYVTKLKKGDHVWFAVTKAMGVYGSKWSNYGGVLLRT